MDNCYYMDIAYKEALKAYKKDEMPVGAVIVNNSVIVATAHNNKLHSNLATDHAEIIAINNACKKLKTWRLNNCVMYVTLEPCKMCLGAIEESRIKKVYYLLSSNYFSNLNPKLIHLVQLETNYSKLLNKFFKNKR